MGAILALIASLAALCFAAWPLAKHRRQPLSGADEIGELLAQRDLAINDIRELDFDRDLGNLAEDDHFQLREASKRRAVAILKELRAEESRIDQEIEHAVASLRATASDA